MEIILLIIYFKKLSSAEDLTETTKHVRQQETEDFSLNEARLWWMLCDIQNEKKISLVFMENVTNHIYTESSSF